MRQRSCNPKGRGNHVARKIDCLQYKTRNYMSFSGRRARAGKSGRTGEKHRQQTQDGRHESTAAHRGAANKTNIFSVRSEICLAFRHAPGEWKSETEYARLKRTHAHVQTNDTIPFANKTCVADCFISPKIIQCGANASPGRQNGCRRLRSSPSCFGIHSALVRLDFSD